MAASNNTRYLYFLEQTTSVGLDDDGFVHHISEARFDAFVEWYGKRAEECGYADNDQKNARLCLVASPSNVSRTGRRGGKPDGRWW